MFGLDVVDGVVIGTITLSVSLHSPKGTEEARTCKCETEAEARAWAYSVRAAKIADVGPARPSSIG